MYRRIPHTVSPIPRRHGIGSKNTHYIYSGTLQVSLTTRSDAPPTHNIGCKFPAATVANTRSVCVRVHSHGQILKPCTFSFLPSRTAGRADFSHDAGNTTSFTPGVQYQASSHTRNTAIQCHTINRYEDPRTGSSDAASALPQREPWRKRRRRTSERR